jgi:hypothetical protein
VKNKSVLSHIDIPSSPCLIRRPSCHDKDSENADNDDKSKDKDNNSDFSNSDNDSEDDNSQDVDSSKQTNLIISSHYVDLLDEHCDNKKERISKEF